MTLAVIKKVNIEYIETSIEIKTAVIEKRIILKRRITFPILIPNRLVMNIPSISEPSKTAPFLMVIPISEPRNKPPKIDISSLSSVNATVERDDILKSVWGDDGDYVGRTLDVFISKLRKKLEADSNIKIINIRGIGYKLVLNEN
jgi:hypothetical protein